MRLAIAPTVLIYLDCLLQFFFLPERAREVCFNYFKERNSPIAA
jgi:hypothetical protein